MHDDPASLEWARWATSEVGRQAIQTSHFPSHPAIPDGAVARCEQLRDLRRRARQKFAEPDRWWLTERGLQQASSTRIAHYKASRLAQLDTAPQRQWADLCSGVGGDLVELARVAPVISIERDPLLQVLQQATIADHGLSQRVEFCADDLGAEPLLTPGSLPQRMAPWRERISAWHLDPDRRVDERRSIHLEHHSPPLPWIRQLADDLRTGCLKAAPAADLDALRDLGEREWIGDDGECKQQVVWCSPELRGSKQRRVTLLDGGREPVSFAFQSETESPPIASRLPAEGELLFEPHAACFAAGAVGALAIGYAGALAAPGCGYLALEQPTTDQQQALSRWGSLFQVMRWEGLDPKRLRRAVHDLDAGIIEWKKRGIPAEWLNKVRDLRGSGQIPIAALIFRRDGKARVALAKRVHV